jgi:hypothetical protein
MTLTSSVMEYHNWVRLDLTTGIPRPSGCGIFREPTSDAAYGQAKGMKTWKLVTGAIITCAVIGLSPYLFQWLGWVRPLQQNAWVVLLVTGFGLLLKLYIADRASDGEFLFYKFGYDNCIVSFGAILTALSLQLQSDHDLFPSLSSVTALRALPPNMRLFLLLLATLVH